MASEGRNADLLNTCVDFLQASLTVGKKESENNVTLSQYFGFQLNLKSVEDDLQFVKKFHDMQLEKRGPKSAIHRTSKLPYDKNLRKKKKFKRSREEYSSRILGKKRHYGLTFCLRKCTTYICRQSS